MVQLLQQNKNWQRTADNDPLDHTGDHMNDYQKQLAQIRSTLFGPPPKPLHISRATKQRVSVAVQRETSSTVRCNSVTVKL